MARAVLALLALALVTSALPLAAGELPPGGMFGGEIRVALPAAPPDPLAGPDAGLLNSLAYESLTRLGADETPVPWLASSWTPNVGLGTMAVDLRTDAVWPDNTTITAADVAWSYGRHLALGNAAGFTVAATDADTVTFTFTSGGGDFLGNAATLPVAWKDGSTTATPNGPFEVVSFDGSSLELAANGAHWNGRPFVDRLSFLYPYTLEKNPDESTKANDAACALLFRDVDLIGWSVGGTDLTTERDCVASHGGFPDGRNRTLLNPDPDLTAPHIGIAENPGLSFLYLGINNQRAPLTDPLLREALTRAIDRDLIAGTYGGAIEPKTDIADSMISPANLAWLNDSVPQYRVPRVVEGGQVVPNLQPVNAFLDTAGYVDRDGDGFRDDPAGQPFAFTLLTVDSDTDPRVAKYLDMETKFRAIGINVLQQEETPANLSAIVASNAFDLFVDILTVRGEPTSLFDVLHSTGANNTVDVASPELDALLESARDALDASARRQAVLDVQGWVAEQVPLAPIIHYRALHAYDREAFEGWAGGLGGLLSFWTFTAAHVTQRGPLVVRVDALQPSVRANTTTPVLVQVRDATGNPVEGVAVELTGEGLTDLVGTTDAEGNFETTFTAPPIGDVQEYGITADAAKPGYDSSGASTTVTVHPVVRGFLVSLVKGDAAMPSGNETFVRVGAVDATNGQPVAGARVVLAVSPIGVGASLGATEGVTDADGFFQTTFTADVTTMTRFLITADVSQPGFETTRLTTSLEVTPPTTAPPSTPALDTLSMVAVIAALAALFGAWQRRRWRERKPPE